MKLEQIQVHHDVTDPVCGMVVDPATAAGHVDYQGETYYFCHPSCAKKFQENPGQYLTSGPAPAPTGKQAEYTCPMHPEIVRSEPGSCPICGMALEPRQATQEEVSPELRDMTRRFWTSVALTAPILALMVSELIPGR